MYLSYLKMVNEISPKRSLYHPVCQNTPCEETPQKKKKTRIIYANARNIISTT